jgi:hypothetical protein
MKRDMELIRLLLLEVEGQDPKPDLTGYSEEARVYHSALLIEAGLVHGQVLPDGNGYPAGAVSTHLTWHGHEFLDAARNDVLWKKSIKKIKEMGVTVSLAILQEILSAGIKQHYGLEK